MSDPYLVPALVALRDEINTRWPKRDKASDGWIGDPAHASRTSSHNPTASGAVRAIDVDVDDNDPTTNLREQLLEAAIGDPRVWYVISNGVIYSRTYGWRAMAYTGENAHTQHVHISVVEDPALWRDVSPWFQAEKIRTRPRRVSLTVIRNQFRIAAGLVDGDLDQRWSVRRVQRALNAVYDAGLEVDGYAGPATLAAWAKHEKAVGVKGRKRIPDQDTLAQLARGRFEVAA